MHKLIAIQLGLLFSVMIGPWAEASSSAAGEVIFLIGEAQRIDQAGQRMVLSRGSAVYPGDVIETGTSGHVHLRFVDQGFVSVRPQSRLRIDAYEAHPQAPEHTRIRFTLEQGIVRSITGKAAESARERFRLNTPLVAIGIKGTDFVVRAQDTLTQVLVHTGAVIVSPLGEGCQADGFGACQTQQAQILSETMQGVMLEFDARQPGLRLIPVSEREIGRERTHQTQGERTQPEVKLSSGESASTYVLARPMNAEKNPRAPSLVWGRWSALLRPGDNMTQDYAQAAQGRQIAVADDYYALYREPTASPELRSWSEQAGVLGFRLDRAQAYLEHQQSYTPVQVNDGRLTIDFTQSRFTTELKFAHPELGVDSHAFQVSGRINDEGIFTGQSLDGRVAGAVSADHREAGYLFERQLEQGRLTGITHWSRP